VCIGVLLHAHTYEDDDDDDHSVFYHSATNGTYLVQRGPSPDAGKVILMLVATQRRHRSLDTHDRVASNAYRLGLTVVCLLDHVERERERDK